MKSKALSEALAAAIKSNHYFHKITKADDPTGIKDKKIVAITDKSKRMNIAEEQALRYGAQKVKLYPDWVSVNDALPETQGSYLTCIPNTGTDGVHYVLNIYSPLHGFADSRATYWVSLPEPPAE